MMHCGWVRRLARKRPAKPQAANFEGRRLRLSGAPGERPPNPTTGAQGERRWVVKDVLTLVLAGGKGTRLEPLTRDRAKPAVPFGGQYRIVDFTLSNCLNSGLRKILVLTQYKARSLDRHINAGWSFLSRELDEHIE